MPAARDAAEEIKQLYFKATKATIAADLDRAIALLISLASDEARERVAVYMDGLVQMRSEWGAAPKPQAGAKVEGMPGAKGVPRVNAVPKARAATPAPSRRR